MKIINTKKELDLYLEYIEYEYAEQIKLTFENYYECLGQGIGIEHFCLESLGSIILIENEVELKAILNEKVNFIVEEWRLKHTIIFKIDLYISDNICHSLFFENKILSNHSVYRLIYSRLKFIRSDRGVKLRLM